MSDLPINWHRNWQFFCEFINISKTWPILINSSNTTTLLIFRNQIVLFEYSFTSQTHFFFFLQKHLNMLIRDDKRQQHHITCQTLFFFEKAFKHTNQGWQEATASYCIKNCITCFFLKNYCIKLLPQNTQKNPHLLLSHQRIRQQICNLVTIPI